MTIEQLEKTQYLNKAFYIHKKIKALKSVKDNISFVSSSNFHSSGAINSYKQNKVEVKLYKLSEINEKIEENEKELQQALTELYGIIYVLNDVELKTLLIYRYMLFKSMPEIAKLMEYDIRTIRRKHHAALEIITIQSDKQK